MKNIIALFALLLEKNIVTVDALDSMVYELEEKGYSTMEFPILMETLKVEYGGKDCAELDRLLEAAKEEEIAEDEG